MLLLFSERLALTDFTMDFDQNSFNAFLVLGGCPRGVAQFSAATHPIPIIAVHFVDWLEKNGQYAAPLMRAAVAQYPDHPSVPVFKQTIERLRRIEALKQMQPPWEACLASGVPVVNRNELRSVLRELAAGMPHGVTLVDGPSGSGRTHSWHLIQHVAASVVGLRVVKVDLDANVAEQQTLSNVFRRLNMKLALQANEPSTTGATPETVAGRYAEEVAGAFDRQPALKAWLVFDSLDRPVPPEIRMFVCALVHRKLDHELASATLFLLGAGRSFGISDPFLRLRLETLSSFLDHDVDRAAVAVNAQGTNPLDAVTLAQRITAMKQELMDTDVRKACSAVASRLVQLRVEVGA